MADAASALFPWRPAASEDWLERIAALDAKVSALTEDSAASTYDAVAVEARKLANHALDARQNLKLQNLARRMLDHSHRLTGLRYLRGLRAGSYFPRFLPATADLSALPGWRHDRQESVRQLPWAGTCSTYA